MTNFINEITSRIEGGLNVAGAIPGVALLSAPLRFALGKVQIVAGATLALYVSIAYGITRDECFLESLHVSLEHMSHGSLNIVWSAVEFVLGLTFIGSLFILGGEFVFRDHSHRFTPVFSYTGTTRAST